MVAGQAAVRAEALTRVAARVRELLDGYEPPSFEEVPTPDAALFLTAIDHGTGYEREHYVEELEGIESTVWW